MDGHEWLEAAGPLAELAESRVGVHPHGLSAELLREWLLVDAEQVEQEGDGPGSSPSASALARAFAVIDSGPAASPIPRS